MDYFSRPRGPNASGLFGHLLDDDEQNQSSPDPENEPP
jgi:hypothetical protein